MVILYKNHLLFLLFFCIYSVVIGNKQLLSPKVTESLITGFAMFGDFCNYAIEENFYNMLHVTKLDNVESLIKNTKSKYGMICDRFKYLTCKQSTKYCVCRDDTFYDTNSGNCLIKQHVTLSCHPILFPKWIYEPFELLYISLNINLTNITNVQNYYCDEYQYTYIFNTTRHDCGNMSLSTCSMSLETRKFNQDLKRIKEKALNHSHWIPANHTCDDTKSTYYLKDGRVKYSIDITRLEEVINNYANPNQTFYNTHCNILRGYSCNNGVCSCSLNKPGHDGEPIAIDYGCGCKIREGEVCTIYYWHDGDWQEENNDDTCEPGLSCVLAHDKINHICCKPYNTVTGLGRCRCNDMIPFLKIVPINGTDCKTYQTKK